MKKKNYVIIKDCHPKDYLAHVDSLETMMMRELDMIEEEESLFRMFENKGFFKGVKLG